MSDGIWKTVGCRTPVAPEETFIIEGKEVARLQRVAIRLFSQERMNADQMRDYAQDLEMVLSGLVEYKI